VLVLCLGLVKAHREFDNGFLFLQVRFGRIFFNTCKITFKSLPCNLFFFKLADELLMRGFALPALVFEVLLYLFVSLLEAAVSDQLSLILGFQIFSVLSFLAQDVKRNVFGRPLHVS